MARHKHADVIIAYAEGKEIQHRRIDALDGEWTTPLGLHNLNSGVYDWRVKPEKKKFWLNIYSNGSKAAYDSRESADERCGLSISPRIACIEVEYEEGQGL